MRITFEQAINIINWLAQLERPSDRAREMLNILEGKLDTFIRNAIIDDTTKPTLN